MWLGPTRFIQRVLVQSPTGEETVLTLTLVRQPRVPNPYPLHPEGPAEPPREGSGRGGNERGHRSSGSERLGELGMIGYGYNLGEQFDGVESGRLVAAAAYSESLGDDSGAEAEGRGEGGAGREEEAGAGSEAEEEEVPGEGERERDSAGDGGDGGGGGGAPWLSGGPWWLCSIRGEPLHPAPPSTLSPEFCPESIVGGQLAALQRGDVAAACEWWACATMMLV